MLKIGIEGLFSTTNLPSDITQKYLLDLLSSVRTTELHSPLVNKLNISPDHLQYTFDLNTSAVWHDGKNLVVTISTIRFRGLLTPTVPIKLLSLPTKPMLP